MCGVVAMMSVGKVDMTKFALLMEQARIRGQHASGVSWWEDSRCELRQIAAPSSELDLSGIETNLIIGHLRYSTSDLAFNQPFVGGGFSRLALAHNGVISQDDPSSWHERFQVSCTGRNDSEILIRMLEMHRHPLLLKETSQAVVVIDEGELVFWRNEWRPLYYKIEQDHIVVASTRDILLRAGYDNAVACEPCTEYAMVANLELETARIRKPETDMQRKSL